MSDAAPAASNGRSSELVGRQIGNYLIEELLGVGGMGQVFRARHVMLDRLVAIKLMHPHFAQDPQFQARFRQEARSAAGLRHPHIVEVFDFDEQDGVPYLVMELITGGSFTTLLREGAAADPGWSLGRGLELLEQAAEALAYAHELGMIHRDIKPDNLLLQPGPAGALVLKVADFGLAKLGEGSGLTSVNIALGTPAYMSPEQCQGRRLDGRSDVYALGVILFELATGVRPFAVRSLSEAIFKHVYMPIPSPRSIRDDIPEELEAIAVRCLAKVPEGRLSAAGLAVQLSAFAESAAGVRARAIRPPHLQTTQDEDTNANQVGHIRTAPDVRTLSETRFDLPQVQVLDETGVLLQVVAIPPGGLSIGRLPSNDLVLEEQQVSRNHARAERQGQRVMIIDLGSRSGTQLGESILPSSVFCEWPWRGLVRIGTYWLRLEPPLVEQRRQAQGSDRPEIPAHAFGTAGRVIMALDPETLTLIPGQPAIATLMLANTGPVAEQVHVEAEGVPEGWVQLPPTVQLAPGAHSRAQIVVEVPQESSVAAGEYPVTIRAVPHGQAEQASEVVVRWLVAAQTRTLLRLTPTRLVARGPGRFLARLTNVGNTTVSYQLSASGHADDPITLEGMQVTVGPGESVEIGLQVGAAMRLVGDERQSRIEVLAQAPESKTILRAEALYVRRAALSRLSAFAVLLSLLSVGVIATGLWLWQPDRTPVALALLQETASAQSGERQTAAQTPWQGAPQTPAAEGIVETEVVTPTASTAASASTPLSTSIDGAPATEETSVLPPQSTPATSTSTQELSATQPLSTQPASTSASVPPSQTPRTSAPTTIVETSTGIVVVQATSTALGTREPAVTPTETILPTRDPDGTALPTSAPTTGIVLTNIATSPPTVTPTSSPTATQSLTPTSTPTATDTATATSTPTATPTSTATSTATLTPTPTTRTLLGSLIFTPDPLDWGSVAIGTQHKRTVTVTNNGSALVTITARTVPGPFSIVADETTCNVLTILNPGGTCQITIAVILTDTSTQTRQLTVTTLAGNQINYPLQVSATGQ